MNIKNENFMAYPLLILYGIIGGLLRYFIIPPCNTGLENFHYGMVLYVIPFVLIGIGIGLASFIFPAMKLNRIGQGIVTGLSVGFGGMTIIALLYIPCIL
jgi:hypothetical protein